MTLEELGYELIEKDEKYYYKGELDLRGTNITILPDNLIVSGDLDLYGTNITTLPDNLVISGYLDLSGTKITSLPDNLIVGGNFFLSGTNITTLPYDLVVGGGLDISNTEITTLPDNLVVGRQIFFYGTRITKEEVDKISNKSIEVIFLRNKEYVKIVGGPFYRVISNKGNIYKVSWISDDKIYYFITNDNYSKYMIRNNLEEAKRKYNLLNIKR